MVRARQRPRIEGATGGIDGLGSSDTPRHFLVRNSAQHGNNKGPMRSPCCHVDLAQFCRFVGTPQLSSLSNVRLPAGMPRQLTPPILKSSEISSRTFVR